MEDEPLLGELSHGDSKSTLISGVDSDDSEDETNPTSPSPAKELNPTPSINPSDQVTSTEPTKSTTAAMDILKGNKDVIILSVIFGGEKLEPILRNLLQYLPFY